VQIVTACHVALEEKAPPRRVGRSPVTKITSVKSADLLATPTEHWKSAFSNADRLSEFLSDFQRTVAGGLFPATACPYPVTAGIYVALRWHHAFDEPRHHPWQINDLDALFRAFFWRNALGQRYDQGFLTQLGTDIKKMKEWLNRRPDAASSSEWASRAEKDLVAHMATSPVPEKPKLLEWLTNGKPGGALQKALVLPMLAVVDKDFIDQTHTLAFPEAEAVELHHIYPKAWCANNRTGSLAPLLDPAQAEQDWVNSIANLMPLSRSTNNIWRAKIPGQLLREKQIHYSSVSNILQKAFVDEYCFKLLAAGSDGLRDFWEHRAGLIADDLLARTQVRL
jgi:hypothetical protein